jgi:hypothetical protein
MSLNVSKVRANSHDPFSRRSRSPIYADHMARWRPESRCRALLKSIVGIFRRRDRLRGPISTVGSALRMKPVDR